MEGYHSIGNCDLAFAEGWRRGRMVSGPAWLLLCLGRAGVLGMLAHAQIGLQDL